jgi:vacuolar-type H+-ATPase subunit H
MAYDSDNKSAAELQREVEAQRGRVENKIDAIQGRLSPGDIFDEVLSFAKGGSGEFVGNLQRTATANPIPLALLGVSLAWLMAKPPRRTRTVEVYEEYDVDYVDDYDDVDDYDYDEVEYPVATISGTSLQRVGSSSDDRGRTFSEFTDDAGRKYKAESDKMGKRAGHFMDEAGNRFRGFTDSAGQQVNTFRDEAGNVLDDALGWASHTWQMAREAMQGAGENLNSRRRSMGRRVAGARNAIGERAAGARHAISDGASGARSAIGGGAAYAGERAGQLNSELMHQMREQPLIAGALAFAAGAAIGAALPHTRQEDELMGDAADSLKGEAASQAAQAYEKGREKVSELHDEAKERASSLYEDTKDKATNAASKASDAGNEAANKASSSATSKPNDLGSSTSPRNNAGTTGSSTSGPTRF